MTLGHTHLLTDAFGPPAPPSPVRYRPRLAPLPARSRGALVAAGCPPLSWWLRNGKAAA